MRVITKALRYWKTEHHDLDNCQDAYALDASKGLFVVADGAGTTLFPALWARILANHFLHIPLMSKDPFEIEWWVRQAQDEYKKRIPNNLHDWSIRQKALNQSSDSTLATLRITDSLPTEAHSELLVFGDSCVIIGNTQSRNVTSFVLQDPAEFAQPPICLPSTLRFFNRSFHTCSIKNVTLHSDDLVIIASDAVAKWIVSAGGGHYSGSEGVWEAFQAIYVNTDDTWPAFIDACREAHEMVNDDSTAIILTLLADSDPEGEPLGITTNHDEGTVQARQSDFNQFRQDQNRELVAIYFGDGIDLQSRVSISQPEIEQARKVADALKELLRHFRQAQNQPNLAARMQPIWRQYGPLLEHEKCAENIRETLKNNGVNLSFAIVTPPQPYPSLPPLPPRIPDPPAPQGPSPKDKELQQAEQEKLEKLERQEIELNFFKKYTEYTSLDEESKKERYDLLLNAVNVLESARSRHQQLFRFMPQQEEQISLAQNYKQAADSILKALRDGYAETIVAAYQPVYISRHLLSPEQLERIRLAQQFLDVMQQEDDRAILTTYDEMCPPNTPSAFQFTPLEVARVEKARERMRLLDTFRAAIKSGRLQDIAASYDPLLERSKETTVTEQALLLLAQEYVAAYKDNDNALVAVFEKIERSVHYPKLAFTAEENNRIHQAKQAVEEKNKFLSLTVAKIKGTSITVDQVRYVCLARFVFCEYLIKSFQRDLQGNLDEVQQQERRRLIDEYQTYIARENIAGLALRELINAVFISDRMTDRTVQERFLQSYQGKEKMLNTYENFQQQASPDYHTFCKNHRLDDNEVQKVLNAFVRYDFFKSDYGNQQKEGSQNFIMGPFKKPPLQLQEWLEKQYKDVTFVLAPNFEKTAQWLTEKLDWKA